ncbi:MAG: 2-C-methyl-D-erythritol 4-phosphate cytidylyltransferase [Bacteriovoracaceae bacterium]|nr:2-C-methyl-D-erythritol 4-phosphate cytidylyltransferase [Bacteroidota bacterium]
MFTSVIIPAAGFGERMGATIGKQFLMVNDKPILVHTLERFERSTDIQEIVLATQRSSFPIIEEIRQKYSLSKLQSPVEGGQRRQDSIANALKQIDARAEIIVVHDAVRPFVHLKEISQSIETARFFGASIVAVRAKDTMKLASTDGRVERTLNRSSLWSVQTPQTFQRKILVDAYEFAEKHNIVATDDSFLVEQIGISPIIVEGSYENIKITTPDDLLLAELLFNRFIP